MAVCAGFVSVGAGAIPTSSYACSSGTPTPIVETWTASKVQSNGASITIFTGPVDRGAQLQIASGPGKALWVASTSASAIMKFSTKGQATLYPTPTSGSVPEAVTAVGSTVLFTEWATGCAGTLSKSGKITEYSTGLTQNKSTNMAAGPKKLGWFVTDFNGIGTVSTRGAVKLYSFAGEGNQPTGIGAGPDGNMWFVENQSPAVGKITPSGQVTEYNTGLANNYSFGITAGPDGRVWFANNGANSIAAITTDGAHVSNYTAGFTGDPISIVAGPDGNLYFGETTPVIGRITPQGVVTEYPFTATEGTFPILSLTVGPDGNIWFANNSHSQIGMLKLPLH